MMGLIDRKRHSAAIAAIAALLCSSPAAADAISPWAGDTRSAARLIGGARPAGNEFAPLRAGLEIRLQPGWHTYWRYPGDAGVPPRFDFSGSDNAGSVDVLWPAPRRIPEQGSVTIGYDRDVIFPLRVAPKDATKPVVLRLKLDYAVCEKLCVPADAQIELTLGTTQTSQDAALRAAEARVPKKAALGDSGPFSIRSLTRQDGNTRPQVVVEVAAPPGASVDLFAEGPTPQWALPVPVLAEGTPAGLHRFVFELDGAPPGEAYQGAAVTLTAVTADQAIEVTGHLD